MSYDSTVLADSPVSYWKLVETSGTSAADAADSNTGTYTSTFALGATGPITSDVSTNFAVDVHGGAGYVNVPNAANLQITGTAVSLEVWVKAASSSPGTFRYLYGGNMSNAGYFLETASDGNLHFAIGDGTNGHFVDSTGFSWDTNWHHIVGTYDGANLKLYVDAGLNNTAASTASIAAYTGSARIADWPGDSFNSNAFPGYFARAAVYNTTLTAARVTAHFNAATGPTFIAPHPTSINQAVFRSASY